MIFESNPEKRITVSELKNLIFHCSSFSAPPQPQPQFQLATPPQSPHSAYFDASTVSSGSSNLSYDSDEGSMLSSGSSSSDDSDFSTCDSPASDMSEMDVEPRKVSESRSPSAPRQTAAARRQPEATQHYALPPQELHGNNYVKPCYQGWAYEHQYDQFHTVSHVQPAIFYPNHPTFFSHYQHA